MFIYNPEDKRLLYMILPIKWNKARPDSLLVTTCMGAVEQKSPFLRGDFLLGIQLNWSVIIALRISPLADSTIMLIISFEGGTDTDDDEDFDLKCRWRSLIRAFFINVGAMGLNLWIHSLVIKMKRGYIRTQFESRKGLWVDLLTAPSWCPRYHSSRDSMHIH